MIQAPHSTDWAFSQLAKLRRQQPKLVETALQQLFEVNQELTWSLVVSAYLDEEINLGKAAELLGLHELELLERFIELGIPLRIGPATIAEAQAEVRSFRAWLDEVRLSSE